MQDDAGVTRLSAMRLLIVPALVGGLLAGACDMQEAERRVGGPYYYTDWASQEIPHKPYGELTVEDARTRHGYYVAFFDNSGRISSFQKILNDKSEWSATYEYSAQDSSMLVTWRKATGEVRRNRYDAKGALVESEVLGDGRGP